MNRRGFMRRCFGVLGGAVVAFLPGRAKAKLINNETAFRPHPLVIFAPRKPKEFAEFSVDMNPEVAKWDKENPEECGELIKLAPGQIWEDRDKAWSTCDFSFLLLSKDRNPEDKIEYWKVACFQHSPDYGVFGAHMRYFTDEEVRKMYYKREFLGQATHTCDCYKTGKPCTYPEHYGYKPSQEKK